MLMPTRQRHAQGGTGNMERQYRNDKCAPQYRVVYIQIHHGVSFYVFSFYPIPYFLQAFLPFRRCCGRERVM